MVFIIGGRYQGKLDFARARYGLSEADIHVCGEGAPDFSKRCIARVERWALSRVRAGAEPLDELRARREALADAVVIADDISCGVVPVDPVDRAWREACGRMNIWLANEADEVWRLFCGIPERLK